MPVINRSICFVATTICFAVVFSTTAAQARTKHHKHHVTHHVSYTKSGTVVRIAQDHLAHMGYYNGKIDGIMGPQTRAAIKNFQREQGLKVDGILGPITKRALAEADHHVIGMHSFLTHDGVGDAVDVYPDYVTSMKGGTKLVNSRFGNIDITESGAGAEKRYAVNLNGQSILTADGQPAVIGISPTYDLGQEDAVIFTTYSPSEANCMYKTHVLALTTTGTQLIDIDNCTRGYHAQVNNGSLYISFPEHDDNRALGATWRVEGMTAERL